MRLLNKYKVLSKCGPPDTCRQISTAGFWDLSDPTQRAVKSHMKITLNVISEIAQQVYKVLSNLLAAHCQLKKRYYWFLRVTLKIKILPGFQQTSRQRMH